MQQLAPPQYSADGRWWWNGRTWVLVTWSVPTVDDRWDAAYEEELPRRRTPAVLWVALIGILLLLLLAFAGEATNWAAQQGIPFVGQATPVPAVPTPTTPAQPAPTDEPSPAGTPSATTGGADAYRQVVEADAARFQTAGQAVADRCAPAALRQGSTDCQAALQSMDDTVQRFQSDLDATSPPACLQPADKELRSALTLYHQGVQLELQGIDSQDVVAIAQGAGDLSDGTRHARSAGNLLQNGC